MNWYHQLKMSNSGSDYHSWQADWQKAHAERVRQYTDPAWGDPNFNQQPRWLRLFHLEDNRSFWHNEDAGGDCFADVQWHPLFVKERAAELAGAIKGFNYAFGVDSFASYHSCCVEGDVWIELPANFPNAQIIADICQDFGEINPAMDAYQGARGKISGKGKFIDFPTLIKTVEQTAKLNEFSEDGTFYEEKHNLSREDWYQQFIDKAKQQKEMNDLRLPWEKGIKSRRPLDGD